MERGKFAILILEARNFDHMVQIKGGDRLRVNALFYKLVDKSLRKNL